MPRTITIYKQTFDDSDGENLWFHASMKEANTAFQKELRTSTLHPQPDSRTVLPLFVSPTKRGILVLLKYHCPKRDNG